MEGGLSRGSMSWLLNVIAKMEITRISCSLVALLGLGLSAFRMAM
jgi:hypothetical protein